MAFQQLPTPEPKKVTKPKRSTSRRDPAVAAFDIMQGIIDRTEGKPTKR
jgi:hypothetical protein